MTVKSGSLPVRGAPKRERKEVRPRATRTPQKDGENPKQPKTSKNKQNNLILRMILLLILI